MNSVSARRISKELARLVGLCVWLLLLLICYTLPDTAACLAPCKTPRSPAPTPGPTGLHTVRLAAKRGAPRLDLGAGRC